MSSYTRLLAMAFTCGGLLAPPSLAQSAAAHRPWTLEELFQRNVGYKAELDLVERVFNETLDAQRKGAAK